ncbi:MAG TPA: DNA polymerase III subunit beta [Spongiibacteraceae bacterium]|jgi:DNA polymerase-3 subunit beta|nr:DNA polymerase III subunit beta [Spongiibacteraceae bacterium]HUH38678.1 DNA polymerase III subunit beta [Spongiibacteraceae bacterium]
MKFSVARDALLKPLNLAAGVVERRQTLPILANVLLELEGKSLSITGTDLEVELVARLELAEPACSDGRLTVPARKLVDICKSLPEGSELQFSGEEDRLVIRSGRSRFALSTLSASDFPTVEDSKDGQPLTVKQGDLRRLIDRTSFAMAQQDVRYYLNGMLWEVGPQMLRLVATDGHRLALCTLEGSFPVEAARQVILPRKGVVELSRLLTQEDGDVELIIGSHHLRANTGPFTFVSKLVDGKFPDYERVLPKASTKTLFGVREDLRHAFGRTAILSNEKYRGIRLVLTDDSLQIVATNPEQEEAEETVAVEYQGERLEIGFNVSYLLDVLNVLSDTRVKFSLSDANSSALIEEAETGDSVYVVMPMRL